MDIKSYRIRVLVRRRDTKMCHSPQPPTHAHTEERPWEETERKWPSVSQGESPYLNWILLKRFSLTSQPPEPWEINLCCLSHPAYGVLLWQPELGNIVVKDQLGATGHHLCRQVKANRGRKSCEREREWVWTLNCSVCEPLSLFKQLYWGIIQIPYNSPI